MSKTKKLSGIISIGVSGSLFSYFSYTIAYLLIFGDTGFAPMLEFHRVAILLLFICWVISLGVLLLTVGTVFAKNEMEGEK